MMCEMFLHFSDHFAIREAGSRYGQGTGDIILDNIICTGEESTLFECGHNPLRENNCEHSEDAGVQCGGTYAYLFVYTQYIHLHMCSFLLIFL